MEKEEIKQENEKVVEKEYYTKDEVDKLIKNQLLDYIKELNKDVKPVDEKPKEKTLKELKF